MKMGGELFPPPHYTDRMVCYAFLFLNLMVQKLQNFKKSLKNKKKFIKVYNQKKIKIPKEQYNKVKLRHKKKRGGSTPPYITG